MDASFQRIGVVGKYDSRNLRQPLLTLISFLQQRQLDVVLDQRSAEVLQLPGVRMVALEDIGAHADLVIVLGGDGTLLNAARVLADHAVPLIGINLGQLGFLTDIPAQHMQRMLEEILEGHFEEESRTLIQACIQRQGQDFGHSVALNDVVLTKGARGSMIELEVSVDGRFVYNLRADGLILATPTGSTAYALSSGGPIVHPDLRALVLVPICPHTLSNRPIVLSDRSQVEVVLQKGEGAFVNFDVQDQFSLQPEDRLRLRTSPRGIRLLHPVAHSYFAMLREKLHWGTKL